METASSSIGYFDVLPNGRFAYDVKLGFNPENIEYKFKYNWTDDKDINLDKLIVGDKETKEWYDYSLDISDIPPTIFFLGVINTYSSGLSLYVPIDITLGEFSSYAIKDVKTIFSKSNLSETGKIHVLYLLTRDQIDLDYLNTTGYIKSTRRWNEVMKKEEYIWPSEEKEEDGNSIKITKSIQSIVSHCKLFYLKFKQ